MQVTVRKIFKSDTDKEGNKLISKKYDKPFWKIDMYIEGSDEKYSAFANSTSDPVYNMQEGNTYSIGVRENKVGDRVYKNFKLLTAEEKELEELRALKASLENAPENKVTLEDIN